ncbi:MAG: beta-lactamase family protein [Clostridiales bacterium]|nr:beta-lactamase family protein [Clostridiales bacterium]
MNKHTMMEKTAREAFEKGGFNGAWLYAENGEIVSKGAYGFSDPEGTKPLTEDSIFQLASVTKQFTAAAVMLAVRRGLISLEDDITKFFPELYKYKGAKIRHLLSHTSGIPDYFDDADWFIDQWKKENRVPDNPEIVRFLLETKAEPYCAPGEAFNYSNTGYNLLAEIVERVSGIPFEEFLMKNIFEPAGMKNTRCCHIRRDGVPFENYAQATVIADDKFVADMDPEGEPEVIAFEGLNGDDYVFTDIFDMFRWDRVLREGSVITLEEQKHMYTPAVLSNGEAYADEDGDGYGFGWGIVNDEDFGLIVRHSGGMPGVGTWFERFIDEDKVLVYLTNRDCLDARAYDAFYNGMEAIARGKEPEPIVSIEDVMVKDPDKSNWESFCGKYEHPEDDFIIDEVFMKDGELFVKIIDEEDDDEFECRLYPIGENEFGRKGGFVRLTFGDGSVTYSENTLKKL